MAEAPFDPPLIRGETGGLSDTPKRESALVLRSGAAARDEREHRHVASGPTAVTWWAEAGCPGVSRVPCDQALLLRAFGPRRPCAPPRSRDNHPQEKKEPLLSLALMRSQRSDAAASLSNESRLSGSRTRSTPGRYRPQPTARPQSRHASDLLRATLASLLTTSSL